MSENRTIKGKAPISTKSTNPEQDFKFSFGNLLEVPPNVKAELESQGLACRWINKKSFMDNGAHASHWVPFQTKAAGNNFGFGVDANGHITRADLILGVRPLHVNQAHKQFLDEKNARLKGHKTKAKQELRQQIGGSRGITVTDADEFDGE